MNHLIALAARAPALVAAAGERASYRFLEFFTANIRNPNTRRAYARAVMDFFDWLAARGVTRLTAIESVHVAAYVEQLQKARSAPTAKLRLAALRHILMPTSSPIAQAAVPGRPAKMIVAKIRSMMPLASIQPHRPDSSRLCLSANMIEATPSITKNTMSTKVSERTPRNGHNSSTIPTAIPRIVS
jgi:Phage integrase, N-terminal SAM-like domain